MTILSRQIDLFAAVILVVACAGVSVFAYSRLSEIERPTTEVLNRVPVGEHTYQLFAGDRCIGRFWSNVALEPGTAFSSSGEIGVRFRGREEVVTGFVGAYFNPLNQMVSCDAKFKLPGDVRLSIRVRNPNPLNIAVTLETAGKTINRSFTALGPILAVPEKSSYLRVDYSAPQRLVESTIAPLLPSLSYTALFGAPVGWYTTEESPRTCSTDPAFGPPLEHIDLDPVVAQLVGQFAKLQAFTRQLTGTPNP